MIKIVFYLRIFFNSFSGTPVTLFLDFIEFTSDVGCVTVQDWSVSVGNLTRVIQYNDLGCEVSSSLGGSGLGVSCYVSSSEFLDRDVLNVETNVVSGDSLGESFVVHLNGLNFSGETAWGECDNHTWLKDTSFNTTYWHSSNTTNFVNVLKRKTEGLVGRSAS